MTVLITGATGCIGGALTTVLAADGVRVRALVRAGANSALLEANGVDRVEGDIRDAAAVRDATRGCTRIVHLAAQRTQRGVSALLYRDVNVEGTRHVVAAARAEGVARLVFASTLGVHGFLTGQRVDEATTIRPNTPYRQTKWLGEEVVRQAQRDGLSAIIVRISTAIGCGAKQWLPFCRLVDAGRLRLIGGGANATDLVTVDDAVEGIRLAALAPATCTGTYALGGGFVLTARDFAGKIANALDRPPPRHGPPAAPYRLAIRASDVAFRTTGRLLPFVHGREWFVADKRVSIDRMRAELGYAPRGDIDGAVCAMVAAFRADGCLTSSAHAT